MQIAEHTNTLELTSGESVTRDCLSRRVDGLAASPSFTSPAVSLLIKTMSPFQAVYNTSPGGSSEISSSLYESLTYLVLVII